MSIRATPALQRYWAVAGRAIPSAISSDAVKERPMDILTWSLIQQLQPEPQRSALSRGRRNAPEGGGAQCSDERSRTRKPLPNDISTLGKAGPHQRVFPLHSESERIRRHEGAGLKEAVLRAGRARKVEMTE